MPPEDLLRVLRPAWSFPQPKPDYSEALCACPYSASEPPGLVKALREEPVSYAEFAGHALAFSTAASGIEHYEQFHRIMELTAARPSWPRTRCRVIDVGANNGGITIGLAAYGCQVVAFEALPENAKRVVASTLLSNVTSRVRLVQGAVSDDCNTAVTIDMNTDSGQHNGQILPKGATYEKGDPRAGTARNIVTIHSLPMCAHLIGDAELFKIDIEGFEGRAILGAIPWLARYRVPWIHLEFSPYNMKNVAKLDPKDLLSRLSKLGYRIYVGDCFHNILPEVVRSLPAKCPLTSADAVGLIAKVIANDATEYEVPPAKQSAFVDALVDGQVPIKCCMVNILAFHPLKFEEKSLA